MNDLFKTKVFLRGALAGILAVQAANAYRLNDKLGFILFNLVIIFLIFMNMDDEK